MSAERQPGPAAALACALAAIIAACAGCGPRTTFDRFDSIVLAPPKLDERVPSRHATVTADLERAIPYYVASGGLFRSVRIGTEGVSPTTVHVEVTVLEYMPATGRLGDVLGGRARGGARVRYVFRDHAGALIWEEEIRSVARSGPGAFAGVPPPLGGVDPSVEGAAAALLCWLRRSKTPPEPVETAPPAKQ